MGDFPNDYLDAWAASRGLSNISALAANLATLGVGPTRLFSKVINYTDFVGAGSGATAHVALYTLPAGEVCLCAMLTTLVAFNDGPVNGFVITTTGNSVAINSLAGCQFSVKSTSQGLRIMGGSPNNFAGTNYGPPIMPATTAVDLIVLADAWNGDGTTGQLVAHLLLATPVTS